LASCESLSPNLFNIRHTNGNSICAAAIRLIVAARVFDDTSPDLTWNICDIVIWATVEVNLINVSGMNKRLRIQSPET
jgi:hypothetical protein